MKRSFIKLLLVLTVPMAFYACADKGIDYPYEDEQQAGDGTDGDENEDIDLPDIAEVDGYPRLVFSVADLPKIRERVAMPGWYSALYKSMKDDADLYVNDDNYKMYPFYIEKKGKHSHLTCGRALGTCIMDLAFCGYVENNKRYLYEAVKTLEAAVDAMLPDCYDTETGPLIDKAKIDNAKGIPVKWSSHLQAGDGAYSIAIGYDLLYPFMTEEQRTKVRNNLIELVGWLYDDNAYGNNDYKSAACNHATVHFGPVGLAALLFPEAQCEKYGNNATQWLSKAKERISAYIGLGADLDGYVLEGHTYQGYALHGAYPFIHALKRINNEDLMTNPVNWEVNTSNVSGSGYTSADMENRKTAYPNMFANYGNQELWKLLPNGHTISMNDSRDRGPGDMALMGALLNNNGVQLQAWLQGSGYKNGKMPSSGTDGVGNRMYLFLTDQPVEPVELNAENVKAADTKSTTEVTSGLSKHFEGGRVFARSGWGSINDAHFSFTSGYDGHQAHNHFDENNVTFYANGVQFLYDPEYEAYSTVSHSLVQVKGSDGKAINIDVNTKQGKIESYNDRVRLVYVRGNAAYAYNNKLDKAIRNAAFVRESPTGPFLFLRDDMKLSDSNQGSFTPQYVTDLKNTMVKSGKGVIINGTNYSRALIVAYNGTEQIELEERVFGDKEYHPDSGKRKILYKDYYKLIHAKNPISGQNAVTITTLVLPYETQASLPEIKVEEGTYNDNSAIIWTLTYSDGTVKKINATESGISME